MAARKDKQKMSSQDPNPQPPRILPATLSQKPVKNEPRPSFIPTEPSAVVPYPGHTPIPVMNRFSPLGSTIAPVRPNYHSALVSSYDPFQLPPTATPMTSHFFSKSSPYVLKHTANLLILEPHISKTISPAMIAEHHFPPDYVESWYYIFLHQTPDFSHSWFINFDTKFRNELPYWFLHWWDTHGPKSDILPPQLTALITYFTQKSKFLERDLFFPSTLLFLTRYKIPWIMRWNYAVNWETRFFSRQFFVKWWDRFEVHRIAEYVHRDFPTVHKPEPPPKHEPSSPHSSQTALSVEGKSKAELQELAQQILLKASQMQDNEDIESQSSSSCQPGEQTPERPMRWSDYPHGQDPNEAYNEAYAAYDLNSD
ncbi:unnamed protein product [Prunus brigantina]